jgi:hypothetical protein
VSANLGIGLIGSTMPRENGSSQFIPSVLMSVIGRFGKPGCCQAQSRGEPRHEIDR